MNMNLAYKIMVFVLTSVSAVNLFAQTTETETKKVNFRYSQNPKIKSKIEQAQPQNLPTQNPSVNLQPENSAPTAENSSNSTDKPKTETASIAKKTLEIAKRAASPAAAPTEIYKVGVGDVLFISLQNSAKASYFTVLNDGTIDYPLSGEMIQVNNLTTDEIEDLLKDKIKLYENPQISVKVRDYSSHSITILGMVEKAGEKRIQREAVPLYVVKADAVVQPKAKQAIVRRTNSTVETLELKDSKTDDVLIFPGDIVEFSAEQTDTAKASLFYYIGGEITAGGQKEFHQGITLTQAILASGGLRKMTVRKVVVRRKNAAGMLVALEYNLKDIKDGKFADPQLQIDDTIEVGQ